MNTTPASGTRTERILATSVLVIGTGGAGLRASIELAERGVQVLAVGKRRAHDAHTTLAAGGINAALGTMDPEDSWEQHAADTLRESYFLADPAIVEVVTRNAARGIEDLERWGMPFAREADGRISQRFFGAHKYRRTAYAGDYTGLEIQRTLMRRARELNVPIIDTVYITRLLVSDGRIFGAYGFDIVDGSPVVIHADAVILAAGGHTRIWRNTSSRRDENTGDSFRLAALAGGRIRDAELVQFHPSGILEPADAAGLLVSEAARGEGGILRNALGERFMERYDPERMELSTRDRVALASYTEITEGRGTEKGGVYLDVSHLPREQILSKLPRVYRNLIDLQMLDITEQPIEIAPTAHYSMGGVWVRPEDHGTGVDGLYAIGEASSGLHGANRLGGNSLIELLVYGRITGTDAAEYVSGITDVHRDPAAVAEARTEMQRLLGQDASGRTAKAADAAAESPRLLQRAVRDLMTEHAGVVRSEAGLNAGLAKLAELEDRASRVTAHPDIAGFDDLAHAFDLAGSLLAARATLECAVERRETRGCHNRSDFPEQSEALRGNFVWTPEGGPVFEALPEAPDSFRELAYADADDSVQGKLVE
ncbi:succinate dehydrogenase [Leucobacter sp. OLJS4]|uniref:FAD-dependent oxidoreductase n=1 Tax=unclassified Leucobacter TaxID=2621730 RepID=UPI000C1A6810|nr:MULTISPECIES: FAD-dependent oxidoreductase [unclassified Leucobacter]PIJ35885.1 succinate dehydrogenase [Leucobacter sp. OLES1]PII82931.1 succinate dehydrogenase [Leucobacter sp. OLCALW19]PII91596.1 succinate dehydrogenase [Leucobacter sp. OLTLW20]PII91818.1 succinate dehydrogenase [Leucobacter sp. OLAS13]PIJ00140.1 succinate dehydrogenase [Leucobacter sp. OLDS2]